MLSRATRLQAELAERMRAFFDRHDYLACPVTQVEPFPIEQEYATEIDGVPMGSYIEWMRSNSRISATLCPAISVPVGFTRTGLPVGLQLVARPFGERALLEVAHALELHAGLGDRIPPLAS
jgi:amidase